MLTERIERREGIGVVASDVVVQSQQAASGRWYSSTIVRTERTDSAPDPPAKTRHYERRVLVDPNPIIDETIFTPTSTDRNIESSPAAQPPASSAGGADHCVST
jgi:hypothetical protein